MAAEGGVLRQVNVGGIVGICDAARAAPRLIGHVGMAGELSERAGTLFIPCVGLFFLIYNTIGGFV